MGCKAAETTCNTSNTLGPGTANECTVQQWFKKFCKGDRSLEDEVWWLATGSDQPRAIIETDHLTTIGEVAEEINIDLFTVIGHLKQIEKVKRLDKWVLHELTTNQQNRPFEVLSSLILHNNNAPFPYQTVMCKDKCILCNRQ